MAAGAGFKTFNTGDVLSAADVNGYLMQGVLVFADAAARDAAITLPQEGQFAYLKDTNVTTYYTGSAWANLDTTGMTNPMTTTGDMVYSSSGSTPARLGIGSTGNVLTVAGGVPTWAAPAGGGGKNYSLLNAGGTSLSGSTTTVSGISGIDDLLVIIDDATGTSFTGNNCQIRLNSVSTGYFAAGNVITAQNTYAQGNFSGNAFDGFAGIPMGETANASAAYEGSVRISGCNTTGLKVFTALGGGKDGGSQVLRFVNGNVSIAATITSVSFVAVGGGSLTGGKIYVYGAA
jgi:hypothetical protein